MKFKNFLSLCLGLLAGHATAAVKTGAPAPDFTLETSSGSKASLSDYKGKTVVLEWFNHGCPFVKKHYDGKDMQSLQADYVGKGVVWLTINSTNPKHQNFLTREAALKQQEELGMKSTALLADPDGKVGKLYGAKTTPHMYVIDPSGKLVYQGAIDDNSAMKADPKKAKNYVQAALDEVLAGKAVTKSQTKSYGCGVKYAE